MRPEVVCTQKCELGEGPVWDPSNQLLCWLDITKGMIYEWALKDKTVRSISVGGMIGSMALTTEGNYVAALENGFGLINRNTGELEPLVDPEGNWPKNRFNDGKCDPAGRFWAGTMSLSGAAKKGSLYMLDREGVVTKKLGSIGISNGLAWSLDHSTFYFIDTPTFEVIAFDYNNTSGELSNKRTIIKILESDGYPDGMTIDDQGMLWIAHWGGGQVTRWNPRTGEKLNTLELPVSRITSCTFGGEYLTDLYVTSASVGLSTEDLEEQPLAGSLFVFRNSGFKGIPAHQFNFSKLKNIDT